MLDSSELSWDSASHDMRWIETCFFLQESVASDFMKELESGDVPDVPVSYDQFGPATRDELPA